MESDTAECFPTVDIAPFIGRDEMLHKSPVREPIANEGDANLEPNVGMEFESEQEVYSFYNEYARRVGFGVTKRSTRYSRRDKSIIAGFYVCSKYGFKAENGNIKNPRPVTKVGCKAMVKARRKDSGKWELIEVIKEHNHPLTPENVHFFRSHKKICAPQKRNSRTPGVQTDESTPQSNKKTAMSKQSDGMNNLGLTGKDRKTPAEKERRKFLAEGEVQAILEHFMHMHVLNPAFFYATEVDEEQHPKSVFWVDARSRTAYTYFGDVVTFDTTYLTSKYTVPFAPFVGVNHHGQPVLFGCALLADKSKESLVWLFKTWLTAMYGRHPKAIITDQDRVIKAAVAEVFPETRHRLCLWRIMKKVPEKLGQICRANPTFKDDFHDCIYDSLTVDEFEMRWDKLINDFKLGKHAWLQTLYEDRQQWVPVFLKDTFFAGMSVSHRNENVNSFLDAYVSGKTTLKEFVDQYEVALKKQIERETQADFETFHTPPSLRSPSPFEKQMSSVYTKDIFKKFQDEVFGMSACCINIVQQEGAYTMFIVKEWEDFEKMKGRDYKVMWNGHESRISCICRLFEFKGFLCRHALVVLLTAGVPKIPSHYVLKRWTKEMKNRHVLEEDCAEQACVVDRPETMEQRYNDLCQRSIKFAEEGSLSEESYNFALHILQDSMQKLVDARNSIGRLAPRIETSVPRIETSGPRIEASGPRIEASGPRIEASGSHYRVDGSQANNMANLSVLQPANQCYTQESWQHMGREDFDHMGSSEPVYHTRKFYQ
ncbi:protein FAR-RED IMPAIRED RESPONSE 1-like isoform X2 [Magnolia sinica]|nr:protein FAR-RED IMPAIRED RESPONSE 1-like isoform X2 [Magnolia sinica]XP_058101173.1 protein FAR-RED IMPAIRED RESPONSE 1-like isoform X2 [Magnolia sinica]XP_058101174.1 protein FAR-RED IMPAIRED RESPONSE 1-like isoform X2 [Magnolia sinica]